MHIQAGVGEGEDNTGEFFVNSNRLWSTTLPPLVVGFMFLYPSTHYTLFQHNGPPFRTLEMMGGKTNTTLIRILNDACLKIGTVNFLIYHT